MAHFLKLDHGKTSLKKELREMEEKKLTISLFKERETLRMKRKFVKLQIKETRKTSLSLSLQLFSLLTFLHLSLSFSLSSFY